MEKNIDLSKYAGMYTLYEAKVISKQINADIFEKEKEQDLAIATEHHGPMYDYQLVKGVSADLTKLNPNQRVCASSIKGHHILMTSKIL